MKADRRMYTYVCLLRGINVSGQKKIRMQDLRELCESIGFENVVSYVQSGNIVLDSTDESPLSVASSVEVGIRDGYGFNVPAIVRSKDEFAEVVSANPLVGKDGIDESKLCVVFLSDEPAPSDLENIAAQNTGPDFFTAVGRHIYLHCSNGYGRTKLSNNFFEKRLHTVATTRNWRTVNALFGILKQR